MMFNYIIFENQNNFLSFITSFYQSEAFIYAYLLCVLDPSKEWKVVEMMFSTIVFICKIEKHFCTLSFLLYLEVVIEEPLPYAGFDRDSRHLHT